MKKNILKIINLPSLPFLIYVITGLMLLPYFLFDISTDGISYINIAWKYINGDFGKAINGYWSPLYSWMLIPFLILKIEPILATKILAFTIGIFILRGIRPLCLRLSLSTTYTNIILLVFTPTILLYGYRGFVSDIISLLFLIYYFNLIISPQTFLNTKNSVFLGIWGGLAYLARNYNFYFFVFHFSILFIIRLLISKGKENKKKIFRNFLVGLSIFILISGFWISLISIKYKTLTFSTAGVFNFIRYGPTMKTHSSNWSNLQPPSDPYSTSAWDDPTIINTNNYKWGIFYSPENTKYYVELFIANTYKLFYILNKFSYLSLIVVAGIFFICLRSFRKLLKNNKLLAVLLTLILYPLGYVIVHLEPRHIIVVFLFLVIFGTRFTQSLARLKYLSSLKIFAVLLLILLFSYPTLKSTLWFISINKERETMVKKLKTTYNINNISIASNSNWSETLLFAYFLNSRFYGTQEQKIDDHQLLKILLKERVNYYFVWNKKYNSEFLSPYYKNITNNKLRQLEIYKYQY